MSVRQEDQSLALTRRLMRVFVKRKLTSIDVLSVEGIPWTGR